MKQWQKILEAVNADSNLNENNLIGKIKEKLTEENQNICQNLQGNIDYMFDNQVTLLHIAVNSGLAKIVELLIKKGANVNKVNVEGFTPLHSAINNHNSEIANILIAGKADVNKVNIIKGRFTPLHWAAARGNSEMVNVLIKRGADVSKVDECGFTPLHWAVRNGNQETIDALIDGGVDVNKRDEEEHTPLYLAANAEKKEIAQALMNRGANPLLGRTNPKVLKFLTRPIENNNSSYLGKFFSFLPWPIRNNNSNHLGVQSQRVMVYYHHHLRSHYGTGITWVRQNNRGGA